MGFLAIRRVNRVANGPSEDHCEGRWSAPDSRYEVEPGVGHCLADMGRTAHKAWLYHHPDLPCGAVRVVVAVVHQRDSLDPVPDSGGVPVGGYPAMIARASHRNGAADRGNSADSLSGSYTWVRNPGAS